MAWCTSESEPPSSGASDFLDLTCPTSCSRAQKSWCKDVRRWSVTGLRQIIVNSDKVVQRLWFHQ